jgi:membrane associated rhomboid family serine protease
MFRPGYIPPVVKNLLIINVLLFIFSQRAFMPDLHVFLDLFPPDTPLFKPYQLITYMFMHAGPGHIFFNMLGLWMFGSDIEQYWGPKKFLTFYLVCGVSAALAHLGIEYYRASLTGDINSMVPMLGASGALMGVLAAFGFMFPNRQLMLLFPPIPIKAKWFVIMYGAFDLYAGLANSGGDNVAHFAHLGGLVTGAIILLYWRQRGRLYN